MEDKASDIHIQGKDTSVAVVVSYSRFSWAAPSCTRDKARAVVAAEVEDKAYTVHFDSAVVAVRS